MRFSNRALPGAQVAAMTAVLALVACDADVVLVPIEKQQQAPVVMLNGEQIPRDVFDQSSACPTNGQLPWLRLDILEQGHGPGMTERVPDVKEVDRSLDKVSVLARLDEPNRGETPAPIVPPDNDLDTQAPDDARQTQAYYIFGDEDNDCLLNYQEAEKGTDMFNPDTDNDGWFDGPCNERRKLILEKIQVFEDQESYDDFYIVVDDTRYPNSDMDDYWYANDGESYGHNLLVATRTRGMLSWGGLAKVAVEGWEDDYELWNEWTVDDLLGSAQIDLAAYSNGQKVHVKFQEGCSSWDCWDYTLTFRVEVERFADPNPTFRGDSDGDGIDEYGEWLVALFDGGIADPMRKDLFVEVDAMQGHGLHTNAKRLVTTQLYRHGVHLSVWRDEILPVDGCLTEPEARQLYRSHFHREYSGAYRYAILGERLWNDASGVAVDDIFLVDDSTWWIEEDVLAQAATFLHELGHTLSFRNHHAQWNNGRGYFSRIDSVTWLSYDSTMNYTYQSVLVDYSDEGTGGDSYDHNDWQDVTLGWGLAASFRDNPYNTNGPCN